MNDLELADKLGTYFKTHKEEMIVFLQEFIRIKSETYNEKNACEYLANKMREYGYDEVRIDEVGNVLGRIGSGPKVLIYDAHIDTVGLGDESKWPYPPTSGELIDGNIWGRGTVDDKGPLGAITWAGKALKDLGLEKKFTMWVSGSLSEEDVEGSCLEEMMKVNPDIKPDFLVVAEASDMQIIRGHKGRALLKITVPGKSAHASIAYTGDNALIKALPIIDKLNKLVDLGEDEFLGKGTLEVTKVECESPSLNTIPGKVEIYCDRRMTCGETKEDLLNEVKSIVGTVPGAIASIDFEVFDTWKGYRVNAEDYFPSWILPVEHPLIQSGINAYEAVFKKKCEVGVWPFSTNATALCGRLGIPAVGFGPSVEELCHSDEERISVSEYLDAAKLYAMLALTASVK